MHFFAEPRNRELVERLRAAGLNFAEAEAVAAGGPLAGQTRTCSPGTLPTLSRAQAAELIERAGGRIAGS